jgi:predicted phage-related endonuclease
MAISEEQESWAASRVGGLGGTDVAAILGLNKWRAPIEVWQAKVAPESIPEIDSEILWFGRKLEPLIRERYAMRFGCEVTAPENIGTIFKKSRRWQDQTLVVGREPWMLGAADGWISSVNCGLEVKNVGFKTSDWGPEGADEIPAGYFCQCAWYNQVHDSHGWNVAPLFSGNRLSQYRVPRDGQLEKDMYEAARAFWFDYCVPKIEPPVDQTESYGRYLARKFSLSAGAIINNPSPELLQWADEMKRADRDEDEAIERKRLANNKLRDLVGNAQKAITPMGTIGWVRPEKKDVTDWFAVGKEVGPLHPEIIEKHTGPMQREAYLRAWWKK